MRRSRWWWLAILLAVLIAAGTIWSAYRSDMAAVRARLAMGASSVQTPHGPVEYARWGDGPPVLVIHGAGGGWDQGRLIAEHFVGDGFTWISVSRFGYLGASLPDDASTPAQADALVAFLDEIGVPDTAVVAVSGGAPPAIQLAARHPDRVSALVLLASAPFTPLTADAQDLPLPAWAYQALFGTDFPFWLLTKVAPDSLGAIFDARRDLTSELASEDAAFLDAMVLSFLPVTARVAGTRNEGAAVDPDVSHPADKIRAPTLIVHARDDGINPFLIAEHAAATIPGAELVALDSGGHLMLGRRSEVESAVRGFLARHTAD